MQTTGQKSGDSQKWSSAILKLNTEKCFPLHFGREEALNIIFPLELHPSLIQIGRCLSLFNWGGPPSRHLVTLSVLACTSVSAGWIEKQSEATSKRSEQWQNRTNEEKGRTVTTEHRDWPDCKPMREQERHRGGKGRLPCRRLLADISFPNLKVGACGEASHTYRGTWCGHFRKVKTKPNR